jgi:general secretion pathway protein J
MMTRPQSMHMSGFTLLELIVVISILTLIMTASFGALRLGNRTFEAGVNRANQTEQIRATADMLRRQFAQLVPIVHEIDDEIFPSFTGNDEQIRFVAPAPQSGQSAGLFVYMISARRTKDSKQLVLSYAPYDPGRNAFDYQSGSYNKILIESLADIQFAYYGATDPDNDADWHAGWNAEDDAFPRMVRIILTTEDDISSWPDLSFIIRAGDRQ